MKWARMALNWKKCIEDRQDFFGATGSDVDLAVDLVAGLDVGFDADYFVDYFVDYVGSVCCFHLEALLHYWGRSL